MPETIKPATRSRSRFGSRESRGEVREMYLVIMDVAESCFFLPGMG